MKKTLSILSIALSLIVFSAKAQVTPSWPAGKMTVTPLTLTAKTTTLTVTPLNTVTEYTVTADTSLVITPVISTQLKQGAIVYVKVVAGSTGATWTVTGGTLCTMASYTLTSAKTHMFTYVYDGNKLLNTGVIKIN